MVTSDAAGALAIVLAFAAALDDDDFERVARHLDNDVVYIIGGVTHRGPDAVVDSYRSGSVTARRIFDRVEFTHSVVWHDDDTIRIDFSDRLTADGDAFDHHSVQDVTVDRGRRIVSIIDQPVHGQRALLDEFMTRHGRSR